MAQSKSDVAESGGVVTLDAAAVGYTLENYVYHQVWVEDMAAGVTADLTGTAVGADEDDTIATGLSGGEIVLVEHAQYEAFTLTPSASGAANGFVRSWQSRDRA